jgi:Zn-dependent protease
MPGGDLFIHYLQDDPQFFWAVCVTVVVSICIHELAHGFVAIRLGDNTPIETGHMTFNPLVHMGAMSLILLLMAGIAWGSMPVNPTRLRGRHGNALVSAAGPASNVILALLSLAALGLHMRYGLPEGGGDSNSKRFWYLMWVFGSTNIALAIFNMLPVPPLDGSRILTDLSPAFGRAMSSMRQGGGIGILFILVFLFAGKLIFPAADHAAIAIVRFVGGY